MKAVTGEVGLQTFKTKAFAGSPTARGWRMRRCAKQSGAPERG